MFGISLAFSVVALRYHPHVPKALLFLGRAKAILPTLPIGINNAYWLEWVAVGSIIIYILSIGIAAYFFTMHWTNSDYDKFLFVESRGPSKVSGTNP